MLMCDTEKRPCIKGVWTPGVTPTVGDLPLAGDGLLDFGDFFAGGAALGEGVMAFGDFFDDLGDGVLIFAGLRTLGLSGCSSSNSYGKDHPF